MPNDLPPNAKIGEVLAEAVTEGVPVIRTNHALIHMGKGFQAFHFEEGLGDDGTYVFTLQTPNDGTYIHFQWLQLVTTDGIVRCRVFEDISGESGGSSVTPTNLNRPMAAMLPSACTALSGVTYTMEPAKEVPGIASGGGRGEGSANSNPHEMVLLADTKYAFVVENKSGSSADFYLHAFWYEEDDYT